MQPNSPKLRFKEFTDEWNSSTLQNLINKQYIVGHLDGNHGELYPRADEFTSSGVPYITANDFIKGSVSFQSCKYLPIDKARKFRKGIAKNNDVLFAHNATVGPSAILKTDLDYVILSTTATYFRCNSSKLSNNFLNNCFKTAQFIRQYTRVMAQSTRNQVPITVQRKFCIGLPDILEQQKIANFLITVDEKINKLEEKKKGFEKYKKGVMQAIFSQKIRFKKPDGSNFPEWEEKKLGSLGKFVSGQGFTDTEQGGKTGVPFYKVSDMNTAGNEDTMNIANHYVTDEQIKRMKYRSIKEKSIIFAKVGAAIFLERKRLAQNFILDNNMMAFIPNVNIDIIKFVFQRTRLSRFAQVGALPSYNSSDLAIIKVEIPNSTEEQEKIAEFLTSLDNKVDLINKELEQTKLFKKSLLQQMFV